MTEKLASKGFNIALALAFLSLVILLVLIKIDHSSLAIWGFYIVMYANFAFLPVLFIALITLVSIYFITYNFQRAAEKSSLRILVVLFAAFILYLGFEVVRNTSEGLKVVFKNNSSKPIKNIELYGRGSITELAVLAPYADTAIVFRGIAMRSDLENDYENEVSLVYYLGDTLYKCPILQGPERWTVFNGSFQLDFYGPDSVEFNYFLEDR